MMVDRDGALRYVGDGSALRRRSRRLRRRSARARASTPSSSPTRSATTSPPTRATRASPSGSCRGASARCSASRPGSGHPGRLAQRLPGRRAPGTTATPPPSRPTTSWWRACLRQRRRGPQERRAGRPAPGRAGPAGADRARRRGPDGPLRRGRGDAQRVAPPGWGRSGARSGTSRATSWRAPTSRPSVVDRDLDGHHQPGDAQDEHAAHQRAQTCPAAAPHREARRVRITARTNIATSAAMSSGATRSGTLVTRATVSAATSATAAELGADRGGRCGRGGRRRRTRPSGRAPGRRRCPRSSAAVPSVPGTSSLGIATSAASSVRATRPS